MTVWQPGAEMQGGAWPGCPWGPRLSWGLSPPSMGTAMWMAAGCVALTVSAQVPVAFLPSHRVSPAWAAVTLQTRHMRMGPFFSQLSSLHWMPGSESVSSAAVYSSAFYSGTQAPQQALASGCPGHPPTCPPLGRGFNRCLAQFPSSHPDSSHPVRDSETSVSIKVTQKPQAQPQA